MIERYTLKFTPAVSHKDLIRRFQEGNGFDEAQRALQRADMGDDAPGGESRFLSESILRLFASFRAVHKWWANGHGVTARSRHDDTTRATSRGIEALSPVYPGTGSFAPAGAAGIYSTLVSHGLRRGLKSFAHFVG